MSDLAVELAQHIDHTLLNAGATRKHIETLCDEARQFGFYSVCINSVWIELARELLDESDVKVCTVAGFPLGASDADIKRYETEVAVDLGAQEIDVVINIGRLKSGDHDAVHRELRDIVEAADERVVKVILETCLLTQDEKTTACKIASDAGAHFVKTSTGFGHAGATVDDVKLMRDTVGSKLGVKAAGGIRTAADAIALLRAGANRIGASAGPVIIAEARNMNGDTA